MQVLVLPVGDELYALPLATVQQVISAPRVTPVPTAHPGFLGLINVRGEIVPLFDTAALTGTGQTTSPAFAVLVGTAIGPAALAAAAMPTATEVGEPVGVAERPGDRGVYQDGDRLLVLLAIEELVAGGVGLPRAS